MNNRVPFLHHEMSRREGEESGDVSREGRALACVGKLWARIIK